MTRSRLVIFDCDGTLVDSQHHIADAMSAAFRAVGIAAPARSAIAQIIGLSLDQAVIHLLPEADTATHHKMAEAFTQYYRASHGDNPQAAEPLYEGVADTLAELDGAGFLLAVATGNSDRGLYRILEAHDLKHHFISLQTASNNPSKPHPAMAFQAMRDAGVDAHQAIMIGDTTYDMQMAGAAKIAGLGIGWGYHSDDMLLGAGAVDVLSDFSNLRTRVEEILRHG